MDVEKTHEAGEEKITRVVVEQGSVDATNVPVSGTAAALRTMPATVVQGGHSIPVRVLAGSVLLAGTKETFRFGAEGVAVEIRPGVKLKTNDVTQHFNAATSNPDHTQYIARSRKAQPMAVNMYSAFWTLLVSLTTAVGVSLFTRPKSDEELKDLVMGLTRLPDEGPCPWYKHPYLWAAVVIAVLVAINVIYW